MKKTLHTALLLSLSLGMGHAAEVHDSTTHHWLSPQVTNNCEMQVTNLDAYATVSTQGEHRIHLSWAAVAGATGYAIEYSIDGQNYFDGLQSEQNHFLFTTNTPNLGYWFRVKALNTACEFTAMTAPVYTQVNTPAPIAYTATNNSIQLLLDAETPFENPAYTKFAVFCTTNNLFVTAQGSFDAQKTFLTKDEWAQVILGNLNEQSTWCFYAIGRNQDLVERAPDFQQLLQTQEFDSNVLTHGTTANNNLWFAPNSNPPIAWHATGGCGSGGRIGFSGNWNNFWSNFVRLPQQNATGMEEIVLRFTVSHSYSASTPNNYMRFYVWADNGYRSIVSKIRIDGEDVDFSSNARIYFTQPRECAEMEVTFNLANINNRSNILIFLEGHSGYNNSQPFYFFLDNITVIDSSIDDTCVTTLDTAEFAQNVRIYPNPVMDQLSIDTPETITGIQLFNTLGQLVQEFPAQQLLDVQHLPAGHYVLQVQLSNNKAISHHLVKQ